MEKKHCRLMLLCMLIPIIFLFVLPYLGIEIGSFGRVASLGIVLICPLLHIGLITYLFKGNKKNCCTKEHV